MNYSQGSVVEVAFNLPQGAEPHPAIIISCNNANEEDGTVICVMTTSSKMEDDFTFKLSPQMFEGKLPPTSYQARLHLVSMFSAETDIIVNRHYGVRMKSAHFHRMMERIFLVTFGYKLFINSNLNPEQES
jgi:hypothetical protein